MESIKTLILRIFSTSVFDNHKKVARQTIYAIEYDKNIARHKKRIYKMDSFYD